MRLYVCLIAAGAMAFGACADEAPDTTDGRNFEGPGIALNVAPLDFASVDDACYSLAVTGPAGPVWSESNLCGSQYGHAGEISYIGPCDASGDGAHSVTLTVEALCSDTDDGTCGTVSENADGTFTWTNDDDDYQNPCGAEGCTQDGIICEENADTPVEFNLTFMRDAQQGFFDIAVNFNNIFCSAKVDCAYPGEGEEPDTEITLLHNGDERDRTAVVGFACTAGVGTDVDTYLHMTDVTVTCESEGGGVTTFSPDTDGNVSTFDPNNGGLWGAAVYRGLEDLVVGEDAGNKVYWNLALGYQGDDCTLTMAATATDGDSAPENYDTYPYIDFDVQLTDDNTTDNRVCSQHPMNGGNGVGTEYSATDISGALTEQDFGASYSGPSGE